ncbi:MAG: hypothetical protein NC548_37460 [Lachnospiraceae bacterium]|nr:hypothetical protein [Lachnospiraceae bacterium]
MIIRTQEQIQQLATLLLETLETAPELRTPAKSAVKAGLQQAWKCVCAGHTNYNEINKNLPAPEYPVQARAIAVMAVDWLQGDETDWPRFIETLLKTPAK